MPALTTPQLILALDSSSSGASIALVQFEAQKEVLLFHSNKPQQRTNSSIFFQELETAMKHHGKPDRIVVGLGPGSYNGLRSSIAAAQGLSSACSAHLIGLPSVIAFKEAAFECWVAGNARGGHYWLARVLNHRFVEEPQLFTPAALEAALKKHSDLPLISSTPLPELSSAVKIIIKTPDALFLARAAKDQSTTNAPLQPLYLKPAHITKAKLL